MKIYFLRVITFIKESPEKVFFGLLLAIFIFLVSSLAISWPMRKGSFPPDDIVAGARGKANNMDVKVNFGDLLAKKPLTYYWDIVNKNPFSLSRGASSDGIVVDKSAGLVYRGFSEYSDGSNKGLVAFIEGRRGITYVVKEGEEVEGWKVIKIEADKVKISRGEEEKDLLLGGGPKERERLRRQREERRKKKARKLPGRKTSPATGGNMGPGLEQDIYGY